MPSLAVKTLKEVLYLNKGMVYSGLLWGVLIVALGLVKRLRSSCTVLAGLTWFGLFLGIGAAAVDFALEVMQDLAYTRPFGTDPSILAEPDRRLKLDLLRIVPVEKVTQVDGLNNDDDGKVEERQRRQIEKTVEEDRKRRKDHNVPRTYDGISCLWYQTMRTRAPCVRR